MFPRFCARLFMMMVLLFSVFTPMIGMAHYRSFGKSLSCGRILPLLWAKFRYIAKGIPRKGTWLN